MIDEGEFFLGEADVLQILKEHMGAWPFSPLGIRYLDLLQAALINLDFGIRALYLVLWTSFGYLFIYFTFSVSVYALLPILLVHLQFGVDISLAEHTPSHEQPH